MNVKNKPSSTIKIKTLCCLLLLLTVQSLVAQTFDDQRGFLSPAAIGNQNINVDLFRGRCNISIPIYLYKTKHLTLPITLNYSPIDLSKDPSQNVGCVGLGWTLSAGGSISRRIRNLPDEAETSTGVYGNLRNLTTNYNPVTNEQDRIYEPDEDIFTFNFCGLSGTFFFHNGKAIVQSDTKLKIKPFMGYNVLLALKVETPDGVTYTFGRTETWNTNSYSNPTECVLDNKLFSSPIAVTWYLTEIESPEGEKIELGYISADSGTGDFYKREETLRSKSATLTHFSFVNLCSDSEIVPKYSSWHTGNVLSAETAQTLISTASYLNSISSNDNPRSINFSSIPFTEGSNQYSRKLDLISFSSSVETKLHFIYSKNSGEKLKLDSIITSVTNHLTGANYSFQSYAFTYFPQNNPMAPQVLSSIKNPKGTKTSFEFGRSKENNAIRITRRIVEEPESKKSVATTYIYKSSENSNEDSDSEQTSRKKRCSKEYMCRGTQFYTRGACLCGFQNIRVSTITNYDCPFAEEEMYPQLRPEEVGFSTVMVINSQNDNTSAAKTIDCTRYSFINYNDYNSNQESPDMIGKLKREEQLSPADNLESYKVLKMIEYQYETIPKDTLNLFSTVTANFQLIDKRLFNDHDTIYFSNNSDSDDSNLDRICTKYEQIHANPSYPQDILNSSEGIYTTHPFYHNYLHLKSKITTNFDGDTLQIIKYKNDPDYGNLIEKKVYNREGEITEKEPASYTTTYRYLSDYQTWWDEEYPAFDPFYHPEKEWHRQKNLPVETIYKKNGKIIGATFINYSVENESVMPFIKTHCMYSLDLQEPIDPSSYTLPNDALTCIDTRYKPQVSFIYNNGNIVQQNTQGEAPVTMDYYTPLGSSLSKCSLLAVSAKGITYADYKTKKGTLDISNPDDVMKLRKLMPEAQITSYTYDDMFRVTSQTAPDGTTITQEYDDFGNVKCIKDSNGDIRMFKKISYEK